MVVGQFKESGLIFRRVPVKQKSLWLIRWYFLWRSSQWRFWEWESRNQMDRVFISELILTNEGLDICRAYLGDFSYDEWVLWKKCLIYRASNVQKFWPFDDLMVSKYFSNILTRMWQELVSIYDHVSRKRVELWNFGDATCLVGGGDLGKSSNIIEFSLTWASE